MAYEPNSLDNGYVMIKGGYEIERWRIKEYFTNRIISALNLYAKIKKYGWPLHTCWAKNPVNIVRLVMALDQEMDKINAKR